LPKLVAQFHPELVAQFEPKYSITAIIEFFFIKSSIDIILNGYYVFMVYVFPEYFIGFSLNFFIRKRFVFKYIQSVITLHFIA